MLTFNNLNNFFKNISIIYVDQKIHNTKQITTDKLIFFVDENNKVNSINCLDNEWLGIEPNVKFGRLTSAQIELLETKAKELGLEIRPIQQFIFGEILKRDVHPKSQKLFVLEVLINQETQQKIQLVTNTLDSAEGKVVVLALPGATTFAGTPILNGKVMDVSSYGMLTGYRTLGIDKDGLIFGEANQIGKEFEF
ncbi:TyrS-associated PheT N-terminal domain-related protein TapR [Mycoplasma hafezii]|uniref:TyrS-associated PheT N-terminal domain-related protein TapR n=1 Tax=Mycoplasma hafezii TaxID=525886 RepID=UPI003CE9F0BA